MKKIVCLLEGITDRPLRDLGGVTPLQKAPTPNLDAMAKNGSVAALLPPPACPTEEAALMALLGFDGDLNLVRRGPLEACALGEDLTRGQVAFSVRFVSSGQGVIVDVSDEVLSDSEGKLFCDALNAGMEREHCRFIPVAGPRAVLITDNPVFVEVADKQTPHPVDTIGMKWKEVLGKNRDLKKLLKQISCLLERHEINALREDLEETIVNACLLCEGGSFLSLGTKDDISRTLVCTTAPSLIGAAKMAGVDVWTFPTEQRKFHHLRTLLKRLDTVEADTLVVVVPYLWRSTYKGDLLEKVKTIEWLDRNFVGPLKDWCEKEACDFVVGALRHSDISEGRMVEGATPLACFPQKNKEPSSIDLFDEQLLETATQTLPLSELLSW